MSLLIKWPGVPAAQQVDVGDSLRKSLLYLPPPPMFTDRLQLDKFQILTDRPTVHIRDIDHLSTDGVVFEVDVSYTGNTNIQLNTRVHGNACAYTESGHPCSLAATRAMRFGFAGKVLAVPLAATLLYVRLDASVRVFVSETVCFATLRRFHVDASLLTSIDPLAERRAEIDDMLKELVKNAGMGAARSHFVLNMDGLRTELAGEDTSEEVAEEREEEEEEYVFPPRRVLLDENVVLPQDEFAADLHNERLELLFVREGMHLGEHSSGGKAHVTVAPAAAEMAAAACKSIDDDADEDYYAHAYDAGTGMGAGADYDYDDTASTASSSDFGGELLVNQAKDDRP